MINPLSRSLLAMVVFATVSIAFGWRVISYSLFATGVTAIVLTDLAEKRKLKTGVLVCLIMPGLGLLGGPSPDLLAVVPAAATVAIFTTRSSQKAASEGVSLSKRRKEDDDPMLNLIISLPSTIALLAFLALT